MPIPTLSGTDTSVVPFYEGVLESLKGTFEVAQEPFFSWKFSTCRMGRHYSEYGNEHHTPDTNAEELNGPLQATAKQEEFRIRN